MIQSTIFEKNMVEITSVYEEEANSSRNGNQIVARESNNQVANVRQIERRRNNCCRISPEYWYDEYDTSHHPRPLSSRQRFIRFSIGFSLVLLIASGVALGLYFALKSSEIPRSPTSKEIEANASMLTTEELLITRFASIN